MKRGIYRSEKPPSRTFFERADGGSLFLDELATAPMLVQEKLLRVIEYGHLERVGGSQSLHVDVRLICATLTQIYRQWRTRVNFVLIYWIDWPLT